MPEPQVLAPERLQRRTPARCLTPSRRGMVHLVDPRSVQSLCGHPAGTWLRVDVPGRDLPVTCTKCLDALAERVPPSG